MSADLRSHDEQLGIFVVKALCFFLAAFAGLWAIGGLVERLAPWRSLQNPREKILWVGTYDGSSVVLLGDSVFCSYYVNAPELTLWNRLETLSGERVFPGALNAPRLLEMGLMAKLVAQRWPRGTVAFIDLTPTRFLSQRLETAKRGIHYDDLAKLVLDDLSLPPGPSLLRLERQVTFALAHSLFLVRAGDTVVGGALSRYLWPRCDFVPSLGRDVNWHDLEAFARFRFRDFRAQCFAGDSPASLDPVGVIAGLLDRAGIVPVFVLTPLNRDLVRAFAPGGGVGELRLLDSLHERTLRYLQAQGLEFIDLYDGFPQDHFVDLIHTNVRGDAAFARAMSDDLRRRRSGGAR